MIDAVSVTKDDIKAGLAESFEVDESTFEVLAEFADPPMENELFVAVPWSVTAKHVGTFVELEATQREVEIEGVTIVKKPPGGDGDPEFQRYVDWSAVFAQLGVVTTGRPILAAD